MRFCPSCGFFVNKAKSCSKCNYVESQKPDIQGNKIQGKVSFQNKPASRKRRKPNQKLSSDATMIPEQVMARIYAGTNAGRFIEKQFFDAKKSAYVCSPWIGEKYIPKLKQMADNGVDVKIITQENIANTKGRKWFELIRDLMPPGSYRIFPRNKTGLIHTKLYIVDGHYAVFGSANFTKAALWGKNNELIAFADSIREVKIIEDVFFRLWKTKIPS